LYWVLNNERLVIQALPEIHIEDRLPLGIKVSDAGLYKFSISNMENVPDNLNIYLVDNVQNSYYNLRNGDVQLFLNSATKTNQFSIAFKNENSLETISFEYKSLFTSYNNDNNTLALHTKESLESFQSLKIYNLVGQEVLSINGPQSYLINLSQLNDGVYFLKVIYKTIENAKSIKFVKY
ncbi:MAG TPA: T9SS type A sorting domain-containing protein, partial [Mariniflexile sp.]